MNALIYYPLILLLKKPENLSIDEHHVLFHKFATRKDNKCVFERFKEDFDYAQHIATVAKEFLANSKLARRQ